jgi:hypothetical protein
MTADNNLEGDGLKDLREMSTVGSGTDLRFVVQVDRAVGEAGGSILNLPDFTTTKRILVQNGSLQEIQDLGEVNMADPAVLADFISWGVRTYPGQRYFLDFWDHGGGWRGFGWDDSTITGGSGAQNLTLARLNTGIQNGLAAAGIAKFDIIGFDACLMATVEVANALKGYASYLLASEEVEPGHGWDYAAFAGGGALDAVALGRKVIDGFKAQATTAGTVANVTLSLIDNSKVSAVVTALGAVQAGYGAAPTATATNTIATARAGALAFADNPDPSQAYNLVDLDNLFGQSGTITGGADVRTAVAAAVVYHVEGAAKAAARGLAVYFPPTQASYLADYTNVPGMDAWRTFLQSYWTASAGGGGAAGGTPVFTNPVISGNTHTSVTVGATLEAQSAASVVSAFLVYGVMESALGGSGGGAVIFGDQPATVSGTGVTSTWDWRVFALCQPTCTSPTYHEYAYVSIQMRSASLGEAYIPMLYDPATGATPVEALRVIAFSNGNVVSDSLYAASGGGLAALNPVAGSKLRAKVGYLADPSAYSVQWIPFSDPGQGFDATQAVALGQATLNTGLLAFLGLRAENAAGQGDWVYTGSGLARP